MSSTVVSPDAATAGALATAFSVMKPAESTQLAAVIPNTDFLIVNRKGQRFASKGWRALSLPVSPMPAGGWRRRDFRYFDGVDSSSGDRAH